MLPRLVEFLMSLERPGGGLLVGLGALQTFVPAVPPGVSVNYRVDPYEGEYCTIEYRWQPDPSMVPNAWFFSSLQAGNFVITGTIDAATMRDGAWLWIVILRERPINTTVTNLSALTQFWRNVDYYLKISSPEDLALVYQALNDLARKGSGGLVAEALALAGQVRDAVKALFPVFPRRV